MLTPLYLRYYELQDDLEPDTEERAMAVLWSAPEAIEKKVSFAWELTF